MKAKDIREGQHFLGHDGRWMIVRRVLSPAKAAATPSGYLAVFLVDDAERDAETFPGYPDEPEFCSFDRNAEVTTR